MNEKNTEAAVAESEPSYQLVFKKPYAFEGETYESVDLSAIEDLCAADMIKAQNVLSRGGNVEVIPEMSLQYACIIAANVAHKPVEFFTRLPAREAIRLKNLVTGFLYGAG